MPDSDLAVALTSLTARLPAYQQFANYYRGNHRLLFATDKFLARA